MSAQTSVKRITAPQITERKNGKPIVCLTAYDAPTANILDESIPYFSFTLFAV